MSVWNIADVGWVNTDNPEHGIRLQGIGYDLAMTPQEAYILGASLVAAARERGLDITRVGNAISTGDAPR